MSLTEKIVTAVAIFISLLALFVSITQTKEMMDQRSASVWPYISIAKGHGSNYLHIMVDNNGIGPAKIQSFEYIYEGVKYSRINHLADAILDTLNIDIGYRYSNVEGNDIVFKPGEEVTILEIRSDSLEIGKRLNDEYYKTEVTIEYCDIYDKCWRIENGSTYSEL